MAETACRVSVSGRVTGVGFRYSMLDEASAFPTLKGYVRNVGYGEVEALLQGKAEEVEHMVVWMRRGPCMARVDNIFINDAPVNPSLNSFRIT